MSYLKPGDPEALVQCPYNDTHMVRNKRIQYHLIDCRKQHLGSEMKTCPYNAKHVHPNMEHQFHLVHCPDRALIDRDIIYSLKSDLDKVQLTGNTSVPPYTSVVQNLSVEEDWDTEATADPFSLNATLAVQCLKQARSSEETTPVKMRMPRAEPDALRIVEDPVIEQRKQPRQPNAEPSSLNIGSSHGKTPLSFGRGWKLPMSASQIVGGGFSSSSVGRGSGRGISPMMMDPAETHVGQSQFMTGVGRGNSSVECRQSDLPVGQYSQSVFMRNYINDEQNNDRLTPQAVPMSTPVSNTQVGHGAKHRVATATPAFSLNGVGRGKVILPPCANELPLPVFGRGQIQQNRSGIN